MNKISKKCILSVLILMLGVCCIFGSRLERVKAGDNKIRFAWITDTQNLSYYEIFSVFPYVSPGSIYRQVCDEIKNNYKDGQIQYAIFTGDFVWDEAGAFDWMYSQLAFGKLINNNIPHGILAGNHDITEDSPVSIENYKYYTSKFGEKIYSSKEWYGGSFENNIGHYDLITAEDMDFIIMYMSYGIDNATDSMVKNINGEEVTLRQAAVEWMNFNLNKYSDRKAILCFHDGLTGRGSIRGSAKSFMDEVIKENDNVMMILSGHFIGEDKCKNITELVKNKADGYRNVHYIFHNYQELPANEAGYIRYLEIDKESNTMELYSYSPYTKETIDKQTIKGVF